MTAATILAELRSLGVAVVPRGDGVYGQSLPCAGATSPGTYGPAITMVAPIVRPTLAMLAVRPAGAVVVPVITAKVGAAVRLIRSVLTAALVPGVG